MHLLNPLSEDFFSCFLDKHRGRLQNVLPMLDLNSRNIPAISSSNNQHSEMNRSYIPAGFDKRFDWAAK